VTLPCDCHAHVFGPASRYPWAAERVYTPPDALVRDYCARLVTLGIGRAVLVQPTVYGFDNRAMLDAMDAAPMPMRGVAVLPPDVDATVLADLHARGVRGVRFNLVDVARPGEALPLEALRRMGERLAPLGWHLELLIRVDRHPTLDSDLAGFPLPLVLGHFGLPAEPLLPTDPGYAALLRLMAAGKTWMKLSAPYRLAPGTDPAALTRALAQVAPDRLLWGSDWPHPNMTGPVPPDADMLAALGRWTGDEALAGRILVDNPALLYWS
jgi:2-pyrone-4,6-dicarboxylate lactonase